MAAALVLTQGGPATAAELEEVVVTAQRRMEPLQQVPISATAIHGEELERAQIGDINDLQYAVPNLSNAPANATRNALSLSMRGLAIRDNSPTVDPTVGVYLDEVYLGRMIGANLDTVDLERAEILRGPQGTLFGRNTIGGAVNLVSRQPQPEFAGRVRLVGGDYGRGQVEGMLNLPWNGAQAMRLSGAIRERAGYGYTTSGSPLDDEHLRHVRFQYRISAPGWDLGLSLDHSRTDSGAERRTLLAATPATTGLLPASGSSAGTLDRYVDPYAQRIPADVTGPVYSRVWGASAIWSMTLGRTTLKSISSYRLMASGAMDLDSDATPYDLAVVRYRFDDQHQVSQEVQAAGTARNGRLDWIMGAHYFHETGGFRQRVRTYVPGSQVWNETLPWGEARNRAAAFYAQADYDISARWKLWAGARYNREGRGLVTYNAAINAGTWFCRLSVAVRDEPALCRATLPERSFNYMPWTTGIGFEPDAESMYYLKFSRGVRSGGYNIRGIGQQDLTTFDPEFVSEWELGAKTQWRQRRLRLNAAVFRSSYEAIQLNQTGVTQLGVPGGTVLRNGGEARIEGGELEATALISRVRWALTLGATHGVFTRLDPRVQDITPDSRFLQAPALTGSISVDAPLGNGSADVTLHADYGWRDTTWFDYPPQTLAYQGPYGLLNLQVSARPGRLPLELALWVRNAFDTRYIVRAFAGDYYTAIPGNPRSLGMRLDYFMGRRR